MSPGPVRLVVVARCRDEGCDWTAVGPGADRDADRAMRTGEHRSITTEAVPEAVPEGEA